VDKAEQISVIIGAGQQGKPIVIVRDCYWLFVFLWVNSVRIFILYWKISYSIINDKLKGGDYIKVNPVRNYVTR